MFWVSDCVLGSGHLSWVTCRGSTVRPQARNQDFMWGGANEAKVDQTTEMYFLLSDPFI